MPDTEQAIEALRLAGYEIFHDLSFDMEDGGVAVYYKKGDEIICKASAKFHDSDRRAMQQLADHVTAYVTELAWHIVMG